MYGHPSNPDPWSERQEIPPYVEPTADSSGFIVGLLAVALPVAVLGFSLGYLSGAWGWI